MSSNNTNSNHKNWVKPEIEVIDLNKTLGTPLKTGLVLPTEEGSDLPPPFTTSGKFDNDGPS